MVLGAVSEAELDEACSRGVVVADRAWVALEQLATAEDAVADEVLGLVAEGRVAVVLGEVPPAAEVHLVADAHRLDLETVAGRLQAVPDGQPVVISGDPDELPGSAPGAVLRDLVEWAGLPIRDLRADPSDGPLLGRLPAAVRRGTLLATDPGDRSVVVVPCADDEEVSLRVRQLVTDSIPRVFGSAVATTLVLTPLHRGAAGRDALADLLASVAGVEVVTAHEAGGRRADAVVACFPGQAAGVLSRALVYSCLVAARLHVSVVSAAAEALPAAVAAPDLRRRTTRLGALLAAGSQDIEG